MNKNTIETNFKSSKTAKKLLISSSLDSFETLVKSDGFGNYILTVTYFRKRNALFSFDLFYDLREYNHSYSFKYYDDNYKTPYDFITLLSDYFYHNLYMNRLIVSKCSECIHAKTRINHESNVSEYYCDVGEAISINHVKRNCLLYEKSTKRIPEITKNYITAINLFGDEIISIN